MGRSHEALLPEKCCTHTAKPCMESDICIFLSPRNSQFKLSYETNYLHVLWWSSGMSSTHGNGGWWFKPELGLLFLVVIKNSIKIG